MPFSTTFRPLAEPVYGIMRKATFLFHLDVAVTQSRGDFSFLQPPIDALPGGDTDTNGELAAIFYRIAQRKTLSEQQVQLFSEIFYHKRWFDDAWQQAKGNRRGASQRATYFDLEPYREMIQVLENWSDALHDRACEFHE